MNFEVIKIIAMGQWHLLGIFGFFLNFRLVILFPESLLWVKGQGSKSLNGVPNNGLLIITLKQVVLAINKLWDIEDFQSWKDEILAISRTIYHDYSNRWSFWNPAKLVNYTKRIILSPQQNNKSYVIQIFPHVYLLKV